MFPFRDFDHFSQIRDNDGLRRTKFNTSIQDAALWPVLCSNIHETNAEIMPFFLYRAKILIIPNSEDEFSDHLKFITQGFSSLGWLINCKKSDRAEIYK